MFGSSPASKGTEGIAASDSKESQTASKSPSPERGSGGGGSGGGGSPPLSAKADNGSLPSASNAADPKKRRSSGVGSKASSLLASAKNSLNFAQVGSRSNSDSSAGGNQTPLQKLGKNDPTLAVPQGQHNNAAGESLPGPRSTFRVGVWEDRNKKCRRTMEDTHAFLYNFLHTPAPVLASEGASQKSLQSGDDSSDTQSSTAGAQDVLETDNGYFAIFDGHAGTFAADWCGKKLHIILEDIIRKNPNAPIPELLDQTFTTVDAQLEKLPLKNSGCTAAIAVLRWEDRVPSTASATGSQSIAPAVSAAAAKAADEGSKSQEAKVDPTNADKPTPEAAHAKLKGSATRQRVLYTANVGDARIILCRSGKALRLSYDHKGSDENEGKRIANAGGLILNNRVNGVLAVTRALGDTYMKDLVTGHPYTTETVIQPDMDEFIILACDGLWDVCSDQEAVDLVRDVQDPVAAAKLLVSHALSRFSTDNLSCMIVRFSKDALLENQNNKENPIGVEGDTGSVTGKVSEADKIVNATKQQIAEGTNPAIGVSASNSGRGHDPAPLEEGEGGGGKFTPTAIEGSVEEEPPVAGELEVTAEGADEMEIDPHPPKVVSPPGES